LILASSVGLESAVEKEDDMTEDNIESLWRKVMNSSADNCPMEFAKAVAAMGIQQEREACAKVCEETYTEGAWGFVCAESIRARSNAEASGPARGA
jgi:hypothetical protein